MRLENLFVSIVVDPTNAKYFVGFLILESDSLYELLFVMRALGRMSQAGEYP